MSAQTVPAQKSANPGPDAGVKPVSTEVGFAKVVADHGDVSTKIDYGPLVAELRREFSTHKTKDLEYRKQQLRNLRRLINENYEELRDAVVSDHGGKKVRGLMELLGTLDEIKDALKNLDKWAAPTKVPAPEMQPMTKSEIRYEPKGVILIISPWNYPIDLTLHPLVSAIAAGNCVVVKPSEVSVHSESVLSRLIPKYLDQSCFRVVTGGIPETTALLKEHWDHIMYTGNGFVGRIVMAAAAKHLTPVTLELGGKSPVIIDKSANIDNAVDRISFGKYTNAGQTCIAPDYILVHKDVQEQFVSKFKAHTEQIFGQNPEKSASYGRIIGSRHVKRVHKLMNSTKAKIEFGGKVDAKENYIAPTLLLGPELDDEVMQQEIFGPLLPVRVVSSIDDAIETVNKVCNKPLALYVFADDDAVVQEVLRCTQSGSVCVNSTFEQIVNNNMPFGGVGESGMGAYHSRFGFLEFSHQRSTMYVPNRPINKWLTGSSAFVPHPPYEVMGYDIHDLLVKLRFTGFLTKGQKMGIKAGALVSVGAIIFGVYKKFSSKL